MELDKARVLVVGATGVLGAAAAARLAAAGARLALTGRREPDLRELASRLGAEQTYVLDLVDVEACASTVRAAAAALGGLDGLVVASGVAAFGPARAEEDAVVEELFAVNTFGPIALVRAALPLLSPGASIAVITAVLADVPTAGMASYGASKAALSSYLTAVRREVRRDKITVLDARPPHLETGLAGRALAGEAPRMPQGGDIAEVIELLVRGMAEGKSELVADLKAGTVSLV
ncbi:MAG: SDR family NAD(P)-dependent oxidoreductase [Propionibacteriaceae bacterium]